MNFRTNPEMTGSGVHLGPPIYPHTQEEPSWVANLVGGRENSLSPGRPNRTPSAPVTPWQNDAMMRGQFGNQRWPDGQGYVALNYLQQQQHQQQMMAAYGHMPQGYKAGSPMPQNGYYPPQSAPLPPAQDQEVIELARKKGLNPAAFDCRPHNVSCCLTIANVRLASLSSNPTPKMMSRNHSSMRSGLPPFSAISDWIPLSRRMPVEDQSTCSSRSTRLGISVV